MKKHYFLALLFFLIPFSASAHVKWFVESKEIVERSHGLVPFYGLTSTEVLAWSFLVLLVLAVFKLMDRIIKSPAAIEAFSARHERTIQRVSQAILGLFLICTAYFWRTVISPDAPANNGLTTALLYAQALVGAMYVFTIRPRWASIGLFALTLTTLFTSGFVALLENAILFSMASYFFILHSKEGSRERAWKPYGVEIVRIGTGITLITLAFTEKLLFPELSLEFLKTHPWNFMQPLLPWFDDKLFVLSTGFAELAFGLLFVAGYLTRITTILIASFFATSVTTMLLRHQAWEAEDLVVYAAAVLFLFFGNGGTRLLRGKK
jgi:uncharacterized membrane protein YphA (DoxX/SURF4 family)